MANLQSPDELQPRDEPPAAVRVAADVDLDAVVRRPPGGRLDVLHRGVDGHEHDGRVPVAGDQRGPQDRAVRVDLVLDDGRAYLRLAARELVAEVAGRAVDDALQVAVHS